jgi:hypothetical protein
MEMEGLSRMDRHDPDRRARSRRDHRETPVRLGWWRRRIRDLQGLYLLGLALSVGQREAGIALWRCRHMTQDEAQRRLNAYLDTVNSRD